MLIESVYIYIETLVYIFMAGPRSIVLSVKIADALASYTSNNNFQYKVKNVFLVIHIQMYIQMCILHGKEKQQLFKRRVSISS